MVHWYQHSNTAMHTLLPDWEIPQNYIAMDLSIVVEDPSDLRCQLVLSIRYIDLLIQVPT
jgi:hypothetical protein